MCLWYEYFHLWRKRCVSVSYCLNMRDAVNQEEPVFLQEWCWKSSCRCWELNRGSHICQARALPLSYIPSLEINQNREMIKTFSINKDLKVGYEDENFFFLVFLLCRRDMYKGGLLSLLLGLICISLLCFQGMFLFFFVYFVVVLFSWVLIYFSSSSHFSDWNK